MKTTQVCIVLILSADYSTDCFLFAVIVQLYEKLETIIGRAEATLSSPRTIQLPSLAEAVQNAPTTPTTPLLPPLQDHEIKQA